MGRPGSGQALDFKRLEAFLLDGQDAIRAGERFQRMMEVREAVYFGGRLVKPGQKGGQEEGTTEGKVTLGGVHVSGVSWHTR